MKIAKPKDQRWRITEISCIKHLATGKGAEDYAP